jgi:hypothetical protein
MQTQTSGATDAARLCCINEHELSHLSPTPFRATNNFRKRRISIFRLLYTNHSAGFYPTAQTNKN